MRSHIPCGACVALVPADSGCQHYRPKRPSTESRREAERRARARAAEAVARFRETMRQ